MLRFPLIFPAIRHFSVSSFAPIGASTRVLAVASKSALVAAEKEKLKKLKAKLSKEKKTFADLKKKLAAETKLEKQRKKKLAQKEKALSQSLRSKAAKAREQAKKDEIKHKKLVEKATKPYRRITAFNMFVKERTAGSGPVSLADVSREWKQLDQSSQDQYQDKADEFNEKMLSIYTPKPKAPASAYASFVKENYVNDGRDFADINRSLAQQWKNLSAEERASYEPSTANKERFNAEIQQWTENRIKLFKESKN